jgi:hypothetical protein
MGRSQEEEEHLTNIEFFGGDIFNCVNGIIQSGTLAKTPIPTDTLYTGRSTWASNTSCGK